MSATSLSERFAFTIESREFAAAGLETDISGYQNWHFTDEDIYAFCVHNRLDVHDTDRYNVGYLLGWFLGLFGLLPPPGARTMPIAPGPQTKAQVFMRLGLVRVLLTQEDTFRNGYQTEHLSYTIHRRFQTVQRRVHALTDREITRMLIEALDQPKEQAVQFAGFVVGRLITASQNGDHRFPVQEERDGVQEGSEQP